VERRLGPRRSGDLPRPIWRRPIALLLATALGVGTGLALGSMRSTTPQAVTVLEVQVDPQQLASVQTMRDEAEALTPAGVAFDEQTHELWMPRVTKIELALADPQTPQQIRTELGATLIALERVGVLQPR
jgi:anti-sigma-K factor RskA